MLAALLSVCNAVTPITPTPTTLKRCKSVITDANYVATRTDCTKVVSLCFSDYWRYDLKLNQGESCYIGPEDFGQFIFDFRSTDCATPVLTATVTSATYPTNKDITNVGSTAGCNSPVAGSTGLGTTDVPLTSGSWYDYSANCDAVLSIVAPAAIDTTKNECAAFTIYGNAGAQYIQTALSLGIASMLAYNAI